MIRLKSLLKEYTVEDFSGHELLMTLDYPDYEGEEAFEQLFPRGVASKEAAEDALIAHDKSSIKTRMGDRLAPMFVHVQSHNVADEAGEKYRVDQKQYYNSNIKDPEFDPRVTVLTLFKLSDPDNPSPQSQKDIKLGQMVVKTDEYIKDLKNLKRLSEQMDRNDPVLMHARAQKDNWELEKRLKQSMQRGAGTKRMDNKQREALEDELWDIAQDLKQAMQDRRYLMQDMEQEAEPEGGVVADEYGSALNTLDAEIEALKKRRDAIEAKLDV